MYYDTEKCGARIRQLRKQVGYTQEKLSEQVNVDRSFLCRIETGKQGCSVDLLVQISDFFNVSLDYLILGKERGNRNNSWLKKDISELVDHLEGFKEKL